ncbi:glycoside hydrolase family 2 TIM barrel-domain containing protein [Mucilaginibacter sp.]|uniref:glycoside hydrolase family 2 TIM barrel-domain containing protein n=1 Tax=Mucilaginibacter sp. TaxID=1882438 RepID=UPI00261FDCE9|nr:glycoside hydrolase family 2 TIM barrel-domain containing protein [Mucilaginibacter sp.]MDB4920392.1 glycoside hydrolase family 2 [Mucilaginibacter sp.]
MLKRIFFVALLVLIRIGVFAQNSGTTLFDDNWSFYRGGALSAENESYDDAKWKRVDLPHDWSIEDLPGTSSPFTQNAISQVGGGFTIGGTAWYRKTFTVPTTQKGKRLIIQFDGVYMNSTVFINGHNLGTHPYGYTSFWYDITDKIKFGQKNIIAVEVKNEGQNTRWYSGSGIYRHVWLKVTDPVHMAQWGTFITTPEVSAKAAKVNIKTNVLNGTTAEQKIKLITKILDQKNTTIATVEADELIKAGASFEFKKDIDIANPELWSSEAPSLYTAVTEVYVDGKLTDEQRTSFGIRKISFDTENGFQLNGRTVKLKGGCVHNDNGPLGSRTYDRAEERKVELLKASGFNAIRCAHNPPSPAFLEACDRLGILVIDEAFDAWKYGKNPYDYHLYFNDWWKKDIESMVKRDQNHPSIIMWSIGNEVPEKGTPEGAETAKLLADYTRELDPTRAVTSAVNDIKEDKDSYFATLDVSGYNYAVNTYGHEASTYEADHKRIPGRIMFGTESFPMESFGNWMEVTDHPYVLGDFVWTSFDYIGEASIGWLGYPQGTSFYPWNLAYCGDLDICGWKRPQSYYRDALWKKDQLSIFITAPKPSFALNPKTASWSKWNWFDVVADWNWKGYENKPLTVNVYSSCPQVELFLNNRSLGKKETNRATKFMASWNVPYQPGTLTAIGYDGDKKVNTSTLHTAEAPSIIKLSADRTRLKANNQDLSYITVELTDAKGNLNPLANSLIHFKIEGPGTIVGVGNADPESVESDRLPQRKAWRGKCLVIIKSTGKPGDIILRASADKLTGKTVILHIY